MQIFLTQILPKANLIYDILLAKIMIWKWMKYD